SARAAGRRRRRGPARGRSPSAGWRGGGRTGSPAAPFLWGRRGRTPPSSGWRRRTGIEPARPRCSASPVLKTGGPTRNPDASVDEPSRVFPCDVRRTRGSVVEVHPDQGRGQPGEFVTVDERGELVGVGGQAGRLGPLPDADIDLGTQVGPDGLHLAAEDPRSGRADAGELLEQRAHALFVLGLVVQPAQVAAPPVL